MDEDANSHERLTIVENEVGHLKERVDTHGKEIDELRLTTTRMDTVLGRIDSTVTKIDARMETQESRPAKRWETLIGAIIGAVATGLVGYLLLVAGLK